MYIIYFYHSKVWNQNLVFVCFKEIITFIQQGCIQLIKSERKDLFYNRCLLHSLKRSFFPF